MKRLGIIASVVVVGYACSLTGCKKETVLPPATIDFQLSSGSVAEGSSQLVTMKLSRALDASKTVVLNLSGNAGGADITADPAISGNQLTIVVPAHVTTFTAFTVHATVDAQVESTESVAFTLGTVPDGMLAGTQVTFQMSIIDVPVINFQNPSLTLREGDGMNIILTAAENIPNTMSVTIAFTPINGLTVGDGMDVNLTPAPVANTIQLTGNGTPNLIFSITSLKQEATENGEGITFQISSTSPGLTIGEQSTATLLMNDYYIGKVAEYLFNGNADDTSGKGNDGTVLGATLVADRDGNPNSAYYFSGSNKYIQIPHNEDLNMTATQDFTVSMWVDIPATQNDMAGSINNFIRQWQGDGQGYPFTVAFLNSSHPTNASAVYAGRYGSSSCGTGPGAITPAVSTGLHFIVFIKSGSSLMVYVDNVQQVTITDTTVACQTQNTSDIFIGCGQQTGTPSRCFTGTIDDIRIYNYTLTSDEMTQLFGL